jgi:hypothetical protein
VRRPRRTGRVLGFHRVPLLAHRLRISTRENPALSTCANARQFCFSAGHVPGLIRHRRYFLAAYLAELAPVLADDRAITAAPDHSGEIFRKRRFLPGGIGGPLGCLKKCGYDSGTIAAQISADGAFGVTRARIMLFVFCSAEVRSPTPLSVD